METQARRRSETRAEPPSAGIKGVSLQAPPHLQAFCVKIAIHTLKARKNAHDLGSGLISIPRHCQRTSNKTVDCKRSCLPLSVRAKLLTFNLVRATRNRQVIGQNC